MIWHTTHTQYRRGKGVALALHRRLATPNGHSCHVYDEHQLIHLQLKGLLPHNDRIHIFCWYLPHTASTQLHEVDITARFSHLQQLIDSIAAPSPGHLVIAAGDLNAQVGAGEIAGSSTVMTAIAQHNARCSETQRISIHREQHLPRLNRAGEMLHDMCSATDMILLTGLTAHDSPAMPSFYSDSRGSSRVDHVMISPSALPHLQRHQVLTDRLGSDHRPVMLQLSLQQPQPTPGSTDTTAQQVQLKQIVPSRSRATVQQYISSIADPTTWASYDNLAASAPEDPSQLDAALSSLLSATAQSAGYGSRIIGQPSGAPRHTRSRDKVWYDSTCIQLKAQIMALRQRDDPSEQAQQQQLANQYKKRVARLSRQHKLAAALQQAALWRQNRNAFWRAYKPPGQDCPLSPAAIAAHFDSKLNGYPAAPPTDPATAPAQPPPTATIGDITSPSPSIAEITSALKKMGKTAAGPDGIPAALLKPTLPRAPPCPPQPQPDAPPPDDTTDTEAPPPRTQDAIAAVAQGLHKLYSCISSSGRVPEQWRTALLVPIYKGRGQAADVANYRPLSMPTVACRLWSSIMNQRLMAASKAILPDSMFGFRPGRRCADPLFVLRHLIDMRRAKVGGKFCIAFMDLSGAYDSIDRDLLFSKLGGLGMAAHSIDTLRSLYDGTQCIVKAQQGTFAPFPVGCGLRQGCPLSTTLFNLYIWDLHAQLRATGAGAGLPCTPTAEGDARYTTLPYMSYADDCCLCASSHAGLQRLLDCFHAYCCKNGLIVNPTKCEVMVFAGRRDTWSNQPDWTVGGATLPRVEKFKYLGVEVHCTKSIKFAVGQRLGRMVAARSAVTRRLRELHIPRDPGLVADLFDTIVAPAGSYGCEIWSTPYLGKWSLHDCSLQRYQASVYKQLLGTARATGNLLVFFEMGKLPMQVHWLFRTINYWNNLVADKADSELLRRTLRANVHFGLHEEHTCWTKELQAGLSFVRPDVDWRTHLLELRPIEGARAMTRVAATLFAERMLQYDQDPTQPACPNRQHHTYGRLMHVFPEGEPLAVRAPEYIRHTTQLSKKQAVARCRLSGARIRANQMHGIPYEERTCQRCGDGVDNEHHMLLHCTHPALMTARNQHPSLRFDADVRDLMTAAYNPDSIDDLVNCISEMMTCLGAS